MVLRQQYLDKLSRVKDTHIIKVITGVRRCGKSTLLEQFQEQLFAQGIAHEQCIFINLEALQFEALHEYHKLHDYITARLLPNKMNYVFLDEIQLVPHFEKAVDSLFLRSNVDLYLTGSNAYMLSGELATLLSGRYIEISMLPLSFKEYLSATNGQAQQAFLDYYSKGGFPYALTITDEQIRQDYLRGIYNTVLLKDVVSRKRISDISTLEAIIRFLVDNVGNIVSTKKIADTLSSDGRKTTTATVDSYINALKDAFILYEVGRYDVKGRQFLRSLEKYYVVDLGFRTMLLGQRTRDIGHVLENIVYLELKRRDYQVYIGKVDNLEVDFVAQKGDQIIYYQVAANVTDPATYEREFAPLKKIRDSYPKFVLSLDTFPLGENGIVQKNIIDFLLEE